MAKFEKVGDALLDINNAAELLGTTVRHLRRLRSENRIPYTKIGSKLRFRRADLVDFIDENTHTAVRDSVCEVRR